MVVIRPRKHPATFGILVNLYTFGYKWHKQKKDVMYCLHYVFRSCGGRIRTCDLQVMSLASYQLLHSAMLIICAFLDCVCKGMKFSGNCKTFQRKSLVFGVILTCINEIMRICWFESVFGTFWCVRWRDCRNMIAFPFRMFGTNVMDAEERLRWNGLYGSVIYGHLGLADCCL